MTPDWTHVMIAALTGIGLGGASLRYLIRAEFDRQMDRLDKRYAHKEDTDRRLARLETHLS